LGQYPATFEHFNDWVLFFNRNQVRFFQESDLAAPEVTTKMEFPVAQAQVVFTNVFCPLDDRQFAVVNHQRDGRTVFVSVFDSDCCFLGTTATKLTYTAFTVQSLPDSRFYVHDNLSQLQVYQVSATGATSLAFELKIDLGNNPILIHSLLVDQKKAILCLFDKKDFKICRADIVNGGGVAVLPRSLTAWTTLLKRRIENHSEFLVHKMVLMGDLIVWDTGDVFYTFNMETRLRYQLVLEGIVDILPVDSQTVAIVLTHHVFLLSVVDWKGLKSSPALGTLAKAEPNDGEFVWARARPERKLSLLGVKDFRMVGPEGKEIRIPFRPAIKKVLSF